MGLALQLLRQLVRYRTCDLLLPALLQVSAVLSNRQQKLQELADDLDKAIVSSSASPAVHLATCSMLQNDQSNRPTIFAARQLI
jgi:hypothetical protein